MHKIFVTLAFGLLASGCASLTYGPDSAQHELQQNQQYIVEWIGERPLIDRSHLSMQLNDAHKAGGFAGCNNWFASYRQQQDRLEFANIATTRKICAPALMEQEQRYLEALSQVQRWDFSDQGQLRLWPARGAAIRLWPDNTAQE